MDNKFKSIDEIQNKLSKLLTEDESGFQPKIDKFLISDIQNKISSYWNTSVKDLWNILGDFLPSSDWDNTKLTGHDAAKDFSKYYVNPFNNELGESFLDARDDELKEALRNSKNIDYTIGDYKAIIEDIRKYMTRLIMPQYKRRVEVEDLNRDFWVIGQNLTALNKVILKLGNEFLKNLIAELTGIWDNIYRIWQALLYLDNKIGEINANEKLRILFDYGFGSLQNGGTIKQSIVFNQDNLKNINYGILPYIQKTKTYGGWYYRVYYNEVLSEKTLELSQEQLLEIFGNTFSEGRKLLKIDKQFSNRNIKRILKTIKMHNFVLISKSSNDVFDFIGRVQNPLKTALDFYREFIYRVTNLDNGKPLNRLINETGIWKAEGFIKYLDFDENYKISDSTTYTSVDNYQLTTNIINSFKYLKILCNHSSTFVDAIANNSTDNNIGALKNYIFSSNKDIIDLINDFYSIFSKIQNLLCKDSDPEINQIGNKNYFEPDSVNSYTVDTKDSYINSFKKALRKYEISHSINKDGIYSFIYVIKEVSLPFVGWDLLSLSSRGRNISIENPYFGLKYFYQYPLNDLENIKDDHLWLDFVCDLKGDCYTGNKSSISSFTKNDLKTNTIDKYDLYYDINITVPFTFSFKTNNFEYHDVVRLGKPYPSIKNLTNNIADNYNDLLNVLNNHIDSLNNEFYFIGIENKTGNINYCIDGFYCFDNNYAKYEYVDSKAMINLDNINDNEYNNINKMIYNSILSYHISSSDMISSTHEKEGQTRIKNTYKYINPVLNLRFLNGRTQNQEIEIILTKDETQKFTTKIEGVYTAESVEIGDIVYLGGDAIESKYSQDLYLKAPGNYRLKLNTSTGHNTYKYGEDSSWYTSKYTLNLNGIWNTHKDDIIGYLSKKYDNISEFETKFVLAHIGSCPQLYAYPDDDEDKAGTYWCGTPGTHFAYMFLIFKENSQVQVKKICNIDLLYNYFRNSELEKQAQQEAIKDDSTRYGSALSALIPFYHYSGSGWWSSSIVAQLSNFQDNNGVYTGKITFFIVPTGYHTKSHYNTIPEAACYMTTGDFNSTSKEKIVLKTAGCKALNNYNIKTTATPPFVAYRTNNFVSNIYYAYESSKNYHTIINTGVSLYNNSNEPITPWSEGIQEFA